jgi:transcriptional regulator with XRE-family HTH domain
LVAIQKRNPRQPDFTDVHVARLVRVQRIALGMSQTELAQRIGVSFQQVQHYERGHHRISMGRLTLIATALGVDVLYLLGTSRRATPATVASNPKERAKLAEGVRMLGVIGALRLLEAFAAIPPKPPTLRESIVRVVEGTAAAAHTGGTRKRTKRR